MISSSAARDAITVKRVYGEPYERNGVVVIPAAAVQGGGGGGGGEGDGQSGSGGGFRLRAGPVGAYVIRGQQVSWERAMDLTGRSSAAGSSPWLLCSSCARSPVAEAD